LLFVVLLKGGLQLGKERGTAGTIAAGGESLDVIDYILKLAGRGALNKGGGYLDCRGHCWGLESGSMIQLICTLAVAYQYQLRI
jgi:hypothetical protein